MTKITLLFICITLSYFFYSLLSNLLGRKRPIERLSGLQFEGNQLKSGLETKNREDHKVAVKWIAEGLKRTNFFKSYFIKWKENLRKAHLRVALEEYIGMKLVSCLLLVLLLAFTTENTTFTLLWSTLGCVTIWIGFDMTVLFLLEKRKKAINKQLGDCLKIISNAMKSGYGFFQALSVFVEDVKGPLSEEFALVLNETKLGVPLEDALESMTNRVESEDLNFVVTAVIIQRSSGGNLSEVLDNIATTIRGRFSLQRELSAASAQGKISALILALIPPFLAIYVLIVNNKIYGVLLKEWPGILMLFTSIVMELIGLMVIRKILKIKF